jgi:hypothetical protein
MLMDGAETFTTGRCQFEDDLAGQTSTNSKLFIAVKVGHLDLAVWAMVDTGAPFCIFEPEILDELGISFNSHEAIEVSTRLGPIKGSIDRVDITVLANVGESIIVDCTVLVPDTLPSTWRGNFIGYVGCLQRFRFAVDPSKNHFHFGKHS